MKKSFILISATLMLAAFAVSACSPAADAVVETEAPVVADDTVDEVEETVVEAVPEEEAESEIVLVVDDEGNTSVDSEALTDAVSAYPAGELTAEEAAGLLFMREEEKLAHDVYLTLYDLWGIPIFQNIAGSEQTHTDAILTLIERYGLEDPVSDNGIGVFTDPDLQALYDDLVAAGSESLAAALNVGAAIEEIDILDLEEEIALTDKADIILVYENLMKGSRNHLRSFVSTIMTQTGEAYVPGYLDQASYDEIVGSGIEAGGPGGNRGNGRGGNG